MYSYRPCRFQSFLHDQLQQLMQTLHAFDGSLVMCIQGYLQSQARFADRTCSVRVYVLDDMCAPAIGRDLMVGLGMQVDCGMKQVCQTQKTQNTVSNKRSLQPVVDQPSTESGDKATAPCQQGMGRSPQGLPVSILSSGRSTWKCHLWSAPSSSATLSWCLKRSVCRGSGEDVHLDRMIMVFCCVTY